MQIFATLLAKILIRACFLGHDADAGTVLPDLANVALHKEAGCIVGDIGLKDGIDLEALLGTAPPGVLVQGRRARVVVEAADAADGLVLLFNIINAAHIDGFCFGHGFGSFRVSSSGAAAGGEGIFCHDGVFRWL